MEEATSPEDNMYLGTTSDDSDIVTLEPPKLEEMGNQEVIIKEAPNSEDFNMGSSSSSQYTFCQPESGRSCCCSEPLTFDLMACFLAPAIKMISLKCKRTLGKVCYSVCLAFMARFSVLS